MLSDVAVAAIVITSPSSSVNIRSISTPQQIKNRITPPNIHDNSSFFQRITSPLVQRQSMQTETSNKQMDHMCTCVVSTLTRNAAGSIGNHQRLSATTTDRYTTNQRKMKVRCHRSNRSDRPNYDLREEWWWKHRRWYRERP